MYLFIFEDGEIKKCTTFDAADAAECDAGVFDVIDIGGDNPKRYCSGEWHAL